MIPEGPSLEGNPGDDSSTQRIGAARGRFEIAWRNGRNPRIEDFLAGTGGMDRPKLLRGLIALEVELRRSRGEQPTSQEYQERFPRQDSLVASAFADTELSPENRDQEPDGTDLSRLPAPDFQSTLSQANDSPPDDDRPDDFAGLWGEGQFTSGGNRFQILRPHARGGHGEIFVALDTELNREVALKTIQATYADDPRFQSRFLFEAEVTGSLEHPGIVPVYGLGRSRDGRPYYAMRFIEGKIQGSSLRDAIRRFHDAEKQPGREPGKSAIEFRELLERFIDVCDAVTYAHSRGVIHRDLKPGNIMLGPYGETLVVDWGLAKALDRADPGPAPDERKQVSSLASEGSQTEPGSVLGTPAYMSPEQAHGDLNSLGPRSDVYSLGATLYTLLTGQPPYQAQAAGALLAAVQQGGYPPPRKLRPAIDRALEAVCQNAMAQQPLDRYDSARALADDLRLWTAGEPVSAWREPGLRRARRWARRHRTAMTAAAIGALVTLVASVIIAVLEAQATSRERLLVVKEKDARVLAQVRLGQVEKANDLLGSIFKDLDPRVEESGGKPLRAVMGDRLSQAAASPELEAIGDPLTVAKLQHILGSSLSGLGHASQAITLLTRSYQTRGEKLGPDHPDSLTSRNNLAVAYLNDGRPYDAIPLLEETLPARRLKLGPDHPDTLRSRDNLASAYYSAGRTDDAIRIDEETLKAREAKFGPDNPDTLANRNNLAANYHAAGRYDEASALLEATLKTQSSTLGPDHPHTLITRFNLGESYSNAGRMSQAIATHQAVLRGYESRVGSDHPDTLDCSRYLADCYRDAGQIAEAIELHERTLKQLESKLEKDHPYTIACRSGLAADYAAAGRRAEAIALFEASLKSRKAKLGSEHPNTLISMNELADAYLDARRWADAEKTVHECLGLRQKNRPDEWWRFYTETQLGAALAAQKKFADAEPHLIQGYQGLKERESRMPAQGKRELERAAVRIVPFYEAWDKKEKADEWRRKLSRPAR
jgi:eukaryotic-like serine/threonine-protein kinase